MNDVDEDLDEVRLNLLSIIEGVERRYQLEQSRIRAKILAIENELAALRGRLQS